LLFLHLLLFQEFFVVLLKPFNFPPKNVQQN